MAAELARWERAARRIADDELRRQALASLHQKRFHCLGGAAYALAAPHARRAGVLRFIVALQTISDYLDNLCDRSGASSVEDFAHLHEAFLDALDPAAPLRDYYRLHPHREDGYLRELVRTCQEELAALPDYARVAGECRRLGRLYAQLQTWKHAPREREARLVAWFEEERGAFPGGLADLRWWEFAAACGSTLGIFALCALAAGAAPPDEEAVRAHLFAYFPWIGGLHILMDYGIDQAEDRAGGDLNFVSHYEDERAAERGILRFYSEARRRAQNLPDPVHLAVVHGLVGFYLSDPKVRRQKLDGWSRRILRQCSPQARVLWHGCRAARLLGALR